MDRVFEFLGHIPLKALVYLVTRIVIISLIAATLLLFLPDDILLQMGFQEISKNYRLYIRIVFWLDLVMVFLYLWHLIELSLKKSQARKKARQDMQAGFNNLSPSEQAVLREFVIMDSNILQIPYADPAVVSLLGSNILAYADNLVMRLANMHLRNIKLTEEAREYISRANINIGIPTK